MSDAPDPAEPTDDTSGGDGPESKGYPGDDVVQERESPHWAEEVAVHAIDESLGGFDSEVDDPQLEEAYEIDPEVER